MDINTQFESWCLRRIITGKKKVFPDVYHTSNFMIQLKSLVIQSNALKGVKPFVPGVKKFYLRNFLVPKRKFLITPLVLLTTYIDNFRERYKQHFIFSKKNRAFLTNNKEPIKFKFCVKWDCTITDQLSEICDNANKSFCLLVVIAPKLVLNDGDLTFKYSKMVNQLIKCHFD